MSNLLFSGIPRIRLLEGPTPLQHVKNIGKTIGHDNLYIKREDLMTIGMGGNKIRSLEFWLGDAVAKDSDIVLVAGMPPSNLCRLTAAAAASINMRCIIFHNAIKPDEYDGNMLLNKLMGTETVYCGLISEEERYQQMYSYAEDLKRQGHRPYIIADPVVGALGYVSSALELVQQAEEKNIDLKHIFICSSAGPTEAGLLYGLSLFGKSFKVHFVSVEYDEHTFRGILGEIYDGLCKKLDLVPPGKIDDIGVFYDDYLGDGYAKPTDECIEAVKLLAQKEAIFIETTYNAKVYTGMFDLIKCGIIDPEEAVCCYHTGGTPVLFSQNKLF